MDKTYNDLSGRSADGKPRSVTYIKVCTPVI